MCSEVNEHLAANTSSRNDEEEQGSPNAILERTLTDASGITNVGDSQLCREVLRDIQVVNEPVIGSLETVIDSPCQPTSPEITRDHPLCLPPTDQIVRFCKQGSTSDFSSASNAPWRSASLLPDISDILTSTVVFPSLPLIGNGHQSLRMNLATPKTLTQRRLIKVNRPIYALLNSSEAHLQSHVSCLCHASCQGTRKTHVLRRKSIFLPHLTPRHQPPGHHRLVRKQLRLTQKNCRSP